MIRLLIFILNLLALKATAQSLVANGSLEDRNVCVEYHAKCAPEAWFFIPGYVKSSPTADSNHFEIISMGQYARDFRHGNYMYTKLLCPLKEGHAYTASISIKIPFAKFEYMDVWMGNEEPGLVPLNDETDAPAFTFLKEHLQDGKGGWKKLTYTFTAKGNERFMMIGNLSPNQVNSVRRSYSQQYYIDNIELSPLDSSDKTCKEYSAILKQVYDQNFRHPPKLIEEIPVDTSLIPGYVKESKPPKQIEYVIVDTPPGFKRLADTLIIPDVLFEFNSSTINKAFIKRLDNLINKISGKTYSRITITGHTDNIGTTAYNHTLSLNRAKAIADYVALKMNIDKRIIEVKGLGEEQPVSSNKTAEGRQKNRRVEIILNR